MGKNDEAIPKLEEAVEVDKKGSEALPENGNLHRALATAYHYAGRHELKYEVQTYA